MSMLFSESMRAQRALWRASYAPGKWEEMIEHAARGRAKMEFVRSRFKAPWYGIVITREKRKGCGDLCRIRVLRDRRGNWLRKPLLKTLDEHWLVPCEAWFDPDAPYNTGMPVAVHDLLWDAAVEVIARRAEKKRLRAVWRGR